MEAQRNPNEPIKPTAPGQQGGQKRGGGQKADRDKQGGQQGGGQRSGGR